jgi:hypothetical protein
LPGDVDGIGWADEELLEMARAGSWGALYVQPMDPPLGIGTGDTVLHSLGERRPRRVDELDLDLLADLDQGIGGYGALKRAGYLEWNVTDAGRAALDCAASGEPLDRYEANVARCVAFVKKHPEWRLSMQTHKYARIP